MRISELLRTKETLIIAFAGILLYVNYFYIVGILVRLDEMLLSFLLKQYGLYILVKILIYLISFTVLLILSLRMIRNTGTINIKEAEAADGVDKGQGNIRAFMMMLLVLLPIVFGLSIFLNYKTALTTPTAYSVQFQGVNNMINMVIEIVWTVLNFLYFIIIGSMLLPKKN